MISSDSPWFGDILMKVGMNKTGSRFYFVGRKWAEGLYMLSFPTPLLVTASKAKWTDRDVAPLGIWLKYSVASGANQILSISAGRVTGHTPQRCWQLRFLQFESFSNSNKGIFEVRTEKSWNQINFVSTRRGFSVHYSSRMRCQPIRFSQGVERPVVFFSARDRPGVSQGVFSWLLPFI